VRVAPDHLSHHRGDHVGKGEMPGFLGDARVEDHLEQEVAEFVAQIRHVAPRDGVGHLVGLLHRIGRDAGEILRHVPGAADLRVPKRRHQGQQFHDVHHVVSRVSHPSDVP
jgi:hypothetical protein